MNTKQNPTTSGTSSNKNTKDKTNPQPAESCSTHPQSGQQDCCSAKSPADCDKDQNDIDEASRESFPASDPPARNSSKV